MIQDHQPRPIRWLVALPRDTLGPSLRKGALTRASWESRSTTPLKRTHIEWTGWPLSLRQVPRLRAIIAAFPEQSATQPAVMVFVIPSCLRTMTFLPAPFSSKDLIDAGRSTSQPSASAISSKWLSSFERSS